MGLFGFGKKKEPPKRVSYTHASGYEPAKAETPAPKRELTAEEIYAQAEREYRAKNYEKAQSLYTKAAQMGSADAQLMCGLMCANSKSTATDKAKALYWYEKAAGQGLAKAQYYCGIMYEQGEGTTKDLEKARMWYGKAAGQGHKYATSAYARLQASSAPAPSPKAEVPAATAEQLFQEGLTAYDAGDEQKALKLFEQAAGQGHADAQLNCGIMYHFGQGTAVDKAKAKMWYEKAAAQGHEKARAALARLKAPTEEPEDLAAAAARAVRAEMLFYDGLTVYDDGDYKEAFKLFEQAAELGQAAAQLNCALMCEFGLGTAMDYAKAKMWAEKAAAQTKDQKVQENARKKLQEWF